MTRCLSVVEMRAVSEDTRFWRHTCTASKWQLLHSISVKLSVGGIAL